MTEPHIRSSWTGARDRRASRRHDTLRPGTAARVIGGREVRLLDLSRRGLLVETETRLAIGAKTTIRIATLEGILFVRGLVVRSRVTCVGKSLVFQTALALDEDLALAELVAPDALDDGDEPDADTLLETIGIVSPLASEPDTLELTLTIPDALVEFRHRVVEHGDEPLG